MDKKTFSLVHQVARQGAIDAIRNAPEGYHVTIRPSTRSLDQNSRLWAMLGEISKQVVWHGRRLHPEDWKTVFTASMKTLDVVPNIHNSGFVALGQSTSKMTVRELSDLMELILAFGVEHGVVFNDERVAA